MTIQISKLGTGCFDVGTDTVDDPLFAGDSFERDYTYAEEFQNDDPAQPINPADFTGFTPTVVVEGSPFAVAAAFNTPTNGTLTLTIAEAVTVVGEFCYEVTIADVGAITRVLQKGTIKVSAKVVP